jgi:GTP-binding protein EngB required for normal cell division
VSVSFTRLDPPSETTYLRERVTRLKSALEWAGDALAPDVKRSIGATVKRCEERLALGVDTTIVALAGGTGSGKSSLFNAIARMDFAMAGVSRPTTAQVSAATWGGRADALLDWLGVDPDRRLACETALDTDVESQFRGMILLDLPDHDSVQPKNRAIVDRIVPMADLLVWVVDPQKYADHALHSRYLSAVAESGAPSAVILNHTDRLTRKDADAILFDIRRLLAEKGIDSVPVLLTSATTGAGIDSVRSVLANVARRRSVAAESVRAELVAAGRLLADALAKDSDPALPEPAELANELAKAAGVDVRARAAGEVAAGRQAAYPGLAILTAAAVSPLREAWIDAATDGLPRTWRLVLSKAIARPAAIAELVNDGLGVVRWPEVKPARRRFGRTSVAPSMEAAILGLGREAVLAAIGDDVVEPTQMVHQAYRALDELTQLG